MSMWKGYTIILILFLAMPSMAESKIKVAVSVSDFSSILKEIGGDDVELIYILPPYTDPHSFSLTRNKIEEIKSANFVILANSNLLSYERKIKELYAKDWIDFPDYKKNGADLLPFNGYEENPHGYWLYAENAIAIAKTIAIKLQEITGNEIYMQRFIKFRNKILRIKNCTINESMIVGIYGKKVVAGVPGVCYIAANYGINIDGILMEEGSGSIGAKKIKEIEEKMKNGEYLGIVVPDFMKNSKVGEIAEIVAKDTGSRVIYVKFASNLNYDEIMYYNFIQFLEGGKIEENKYSYGVLLLIATLVIFAIIEGGIIYVLQRR